jgi:hypothetical protein
MQSWIPPPELRETTAPPHHIRILITVAATALLCLLSTLRLLTGPLGALPLQDPTREIARHADERFADMRRALPKRGVVGYIGDSGQTSLADYYSAQYALAPLLVERSINHSLVIGNFPASQPPMPALAEKNLGLVRDFQNGLFLFAKKDNN